MCSLLLNSIEDKTVCRHTVCSQKHFKKENATKNTSEWVHVARSWEKQATGSSKPRPEIIKNIHPQLALQLHTEKPLYLHTAVNWCGFYARISYNFNFCEILSCRPWLQVKLSLIRLHLSQSLLHIMSALFQALSAHGLLSIGPTN